ncbi:MAG: DUF5131 family protein [Lachnospiraceae bacterium]|nr:DUF5131 family protein [Lachnospiraceae bacterium]
MAEWNPWHGCRKFSAGCENCYVYRRDKKYDIDSSIVRKNSSFSLPVKRKRDKSYAIPSGETVFTCFTSDFFVEEADEWRAEAWSMMKERSDLKFLFLTKRIHRFLSVVPPDWGDGYENVSIGCTVENQVACDSRLPLFIELPIKEKFIICEPCLSAIDLSPYLTHGIKQVIAGGESGNEARICDYSWILGIREACRKANVSFRFKQTGARLVKDGKLYRIKRIYQHSQAQKAKIDLF